MLLLLGNEGEERPQREPVKIALHAENDRSNVIVVAHTVDNALRWEKNAQDTALP